MAITTSGLIVPDGCIEPKDHAHIYLDASGSKEEARSWGCVIVPNDPLHSAIDDLITRLRKKHPKAISDDGREIKGRDLPQDALVDSSDFLNRSGCVAFGYPVPDYSQLAVLRTAFISYFQSLRPHRSRKDADTIQKRVDQLIRYAKKGAGKTKTRPKNLNVLLSIEALFSRIHDAVRMRRLGPYLRRVTVRIDRENMPKPRLFSWAVKVIASSELQSAGMLPAHTGNLMNEDADEGDVQVYGDTNSKECNGVQAADIVASGQEKGLLKWMT